MCCSVHDFTVMDNEMLKWEFSSVGEFSVSAGITHEITTSILSFVSASSLSGQPACNLIDVVAILYITYLFFC